MSACTCYTLTGGSSDITVVTIPAPATNGEAERDDLAAQESVEQSVATLMGEIGKHIEGQFQVAAASANVQVDGVIPVTSTVSNSEQSSVKGECMT